MKLTKRLFIGALCLLLFFALSSCSNMRYGTDAGLNVTWGPHGPKVRPHVDFDIYNGGRFN